MKQLASVIFFFFLFFANSYSQTVNCGSSTLTIKVDKDTLNNSSVRSYTFEGTPPTYDMYPSKALENGIQGRVTVGFYVDENCRIKNVRIVKGLGYGLDEIALEYVKCMQEELNKHTKEDCLELKELREILLPVMFRIIKK